MIVESLDELADLIVPLFADVENKNVEVPEWLDHPYGQDQVKVSIVCAQHNDHFPLVLLNVSKILVETAYMVFLCHVTWHYMSVWEWESFGQVIKLSMLFI